MIKYLLSFFAFAIHDTAYTIDGPIQFNEPMYGPLIVYKHPTYITLYSIFDRQDIHLVFPSGDQELYIVYPSGKKVPCYYVSGTPFTLKEGQRLCVQKKQRKGLTFMYTFTDIGNQWPIQDT